MSCCSSPVSQRSSISCTRSPGCHSPSTAATTPTSSCAFSPKIEQLQSYTYNQPSSPNFQELNYSYNYSPSPNEIPYGYALPQVPSPANTYLQPPSPAGTPYQPYNYNYQQPSPSLTPPVTSNPIPKYSGYPPASAFYGPSPSSSTASSSLVPSSSSSPSRQSQYRRKSPARINPEDYKFEDWYTADGRKVEYSPVHLNCATM